MGTSKDYKVIYSYQFIISGSSWMPKSVQNDKILNWTFHVRFKRFSILIPPTNNFQHVHENWENYLIQDSRYVSKILKRKKKTEKI